MNKQYIILMAMIILGCLSATIIVSEYNQPQEEYITTNNLTYAFYNHTTGEATYLDSGIPVYEKMYKD